MILVTISLHQVLADHVKSILNVSMFDGRPIRVKIDGREYGPLSNNHEIINLRPGHHNIQVISKAYRHHGFMPHWTTEYSGVIDIIPGYEIDAVVGRHHNLRIVNSTALYRPPVVKPHRPAHYGNHGYPCQIYPVVTCGTDNYGYVPFPEPVPYMSPADFQDFKYSISARWFESTKEQIAKQVIADNYFTSAQIKELLALFTFENTRLEIARFAYDRVVDPERYYVTYDAFTFESSIRDLNTYMAHR